MVAVPSSFALLGGFAIGARVSLLWQHNTERETSASASARSMPGCGCPSIRQVPEQVLEYFRKTEVYYLFFYK